MFLDYEQFNESTDYSLKTARVVARHLADFLNDCEEGKYPNIQIVPTPGAESYVGVALNDGESLSRVFDVSDPKVALVAIVMKNTGKSDPESIKREMESDDINWLDYAVFAGDRPMTQEEVAKKYNFNYQVPAGDAVGVFTSTPIKKTL